MSTLGEIRQAIASVIEDGTDGLYVYPYATVNLLEPAAIVFLPDLVEYRQDIGYVSGAPAKRYLIPVQIRVSYANPLPANDALDGWIDVVTAAILQDPSLDGAVETTDVIDVGTFGTVDVDTITYLACNVNLEVLT
jgi:hypothetical protein